MMIKKKLSNLKNFENDINDKNTPFNEKFNAYYHSRLNRIQFLTEYFSFKLST